jgi:hypothetical protein
MFARPLRAVLSVLKLMPVAFVTLSAHAHDGLLRSKHWFAGRAPDRSKHWLSVAAYAAVVAAVAFPMTARGWYW